MIACAWSEMLVKVAIDLCGGGEGEVDVWMNERCHSFEQGAY